MGDVKQHSGSGAQGATCAEKAQTPAPGGGKHLRMPAPSLARQPTCSADAPPAPSTSAERAASAGVAEAAVRHVEAMNLSLAAGVPSRITRCMRDQGPMLGSTCRGRGG